MNEMVNLIVETDALAMVIYIAGYAYMGFAIGWLLVQEIDRHFDLRRRD